MASLLRHIKLIWQPRRVHATVRTRPMARFVYGPHALVCAIAIQRENAPRRIRAGHVDGENVGECCVNLERTGPHASACAKLHMLRAACSVRRTRGAGSRDDTLGLACTGNRAGSLCERRHWGPRGASYVRAAHVGSHGGPLEGECLLRCAGRRQGPRYRPPEGTNERVTDRRPGGARNINK